MIESIIVKNEASFDETGQTISNLTETNYFYGANGSGKTTISRIIDNVEKYSGCFIKWKNDNPLTTIVYNRNFINRAFNQDEIKGIFTLGEDAVNIENEIKENKSKLDKITDEIAGLSKRLEEKKTENENLENDFSKNIWELKLKYENDFYNAFQGVLSSKAKFSKKFKEESAKTTSDIKSLEFLKNKANTIFDSNISIIGEIKEIEHLDILNIERDKILQTKIIGKEDIDIAALIKKLNNADWVKQGKFFYEKNEQNENGEKLCPFCQQPTSINFEKQLNEYFNESYTNQINEVENIKSNYKSKVSIFIDKIEQILEIANQYVNPEILSEYLEKLKVNHNYNLEILDKKIKNPSIVIELKSIFKELAIINDYLKGAIQKIKEHNETVKNIKTERSQLINEIWNFITDEKKNYFQTYSLKNTNIDRAINGMTKSIQEKEIKKGQFSNKIKELENKTTSVVPTINKINGILKSFGFTNFKLVESATKGSYEIKRENGEDAKRTLSEGEKSFITFLYFYHLINGSLDKETILKDKIIVFDDPVSSLDSNILFIISNLIRKIAEKVKSKESNLKQLFILTHNVYFHKEVTFNTNRSGDDKMKNETFWIIRKLNKTSQLQEYKTNPIKTSYELLWQEIRENAENKGITIHNTLRRILENYFMILGGFKKDDIIDKFEGNDKIICQSLLSWINDGSHFINDDLFIDTSVDAIEKYIEIFKSIFEVTKHIEHYNMMMNKKQYS